MPASVPTYILYIAALLASALISIYAVRKIIFITNTRKLYDIPDNIRKIHGAQIPSLGGIGIFTGYLIAAAFFMEQSWYPVIAASVILFFTGIYDDIMNMRPSKKLVAQFLASAVVVFLADVRISSFHGILGIQELPYAVSVGLTIFCSTLFINVFNFMDGIDGLAGTLAVFYSAVMGGIFACMGGLSAAGIAFSLCGATLGLLWFNRPPARIYMGDTGSMLLGFTIFILAISCMSMGGTDALMGIQQWVHTPASLSMLLLAMLFLPLYDAMRVFALRAMRGISPLRADRLHMHYYLLDAGFTHGSAVLVILITNAALMAATWLLQDMHPLLLLTTMVAITSSVIYWIHILRRRMLLSK